MIDWHQIIGFEWDEGNARKSVDKHSVGQAEAEQIFLNEPLLITPDRSTAEAKSACMHLDEPMKAACCTLHSH